MIKTAEHAGVAQQSKFDGGSGRVRPLAPGETTLNLWSCFYKIKGRIEPGRARRVKKMQDCPPGKLWYYLRGCSHAELM